MTDKESKLASVLCMEGPLNGYVLEYRGLDFKTDCGFEYHYMRIHIFAENFSLGFYTPLGMSNLDVMVTLLDFYLDNAPVLDFENMNVGEGDGISEESS